MERLDLIANRTQNQVEISFFLKIGLLYLFNLAYNLIFEYIWIQYNKPMNSYQ